MKRILVLPNPVKTKALELTCGLVKLLEKLDFEIVLEASMAEEFNCRWLGKTETELFEEVDLVIVLGGDGSMLNAARKIYPREIPLLGINLGHLGFLTRIENNRIESALDQLKLGNYYFEDRTMLQAEIIRKGELVGSTVGLNDLVLGKSAVARMLRLETWIDDEYFTTYPADGLIIATATGSTAYSLSAGGPILDPRLRAILMTPICAHSLYARPVVLSKDAKIKVLLDSYHPEINLTADGQGVTLLEPGDQVVFTRAPHVTKLLNFDEQGLFEVLKSRLKEGRI